MIAKDGKIGNARSEDGDRSLLQVKGLGEKCVPGKSTAPGSEADQGV